MKESGSAKKTGELKTLTPPRGMDVMEEGKPFFFPGKEIGCLLIHGFTGTTSSMKPMGEYLSERGVTVLCPRLPGHGTNVKDMGRWSYRDWTYTVETAFEEIQDICDSVFVSGLSMGGTLTLYLGEKYSDHLSGIMPISAPVSRVVVNDIENQLLKLVPLLKHVLKRFPGPGGDIKDPDVEEVAYEKLSTNALHEFLKLVKTVEKHLVEITAPIRIFAAREDHVVPPENGPYIFEHVGSKEKELIWLDNSYHVATLDYDKEKIFEESYNFMCEMTDMKKTLKGD